MSLSGHILFYARTRSAHEEFLKIGRAIVIFRVQGLRVWGLRVSGLRV